MTIALRIAAGLVAGAIGLVSSAAFAAFPDRPVTIVVSTGAGGASDSIARMIADRLKDKWGQPVVVLNKPGAVAAASEGYVANMPPDGYTILQSNGQRAVNAATGGTGAGYDLVNSLVGITQIAVQPQVLVVSNKLGIKTLPEFIAYAKANPGKINFGDFGTGSLNNLNMSILMEKAKLDLFQISYKDTQEGQVALMSGELDFMLQGSVAAEPHIKSGKITALAIADEKRSPALPNVPTVKESTGVDFIYNSYFAHYVHSATPKDIVAKLNADIVAVINMPEVRDFMVKQGMTVVGSSVDGFQGLVKKETDLYRAVLPAAK